MKNKYLYAIITFIIALIIALLLILLSNNEEKQNITTLKVAEVTHSIFYTPFYVAIENGYFKNYNIDIDLILVSGSDNVAASVLSKDTNIGLAGPESAIYVYTGGEKDYLQVFAGLTKRDGQFLISRNKDFKWSDLIGKEVLVGRSTGMPALSFFKASFCLLNTSSTFSMLSTFTILLKNLSHNILIFVNFFIIIYLFLFI